MTLSRDERVFTHAAGRARVHPQYLGWVLGRYQELENHSEYDLMKALGVSSQDLLRLYLCLRPRADHFAEDITQISVKFNIDAMTLANIVRLVESVEVIGSTQAGASPPEAGFLMAARTRRKSRPRQEQQPHGSTQPKS
jgi:hypothetical protein